MQSLWLAIQFLTIVPAPVAEPVTPATLGRSLAWYPLVGAGLGLAVGGFCWLVRLAGASPLLAAALGLALALALTGALHLDGLLDTADGAATARPPADRLAIMSDPRIGTFGFATGVGVLLVKFAALATLSIETVVAAMVAAFVLGRTVMVVAAVVAPAAKRDGLGARVTGTAGRRELLLATTTGLAIVILAGGLAGIIWIAAAGLTGWLVARWLVGRLGGLTGDSYGALNEIVEAVVLSLASWRVLPL